MTAGATTRRNTPGKCSKCETYPFWVAGWNVYQCRCPSGRPTAAQGNGQHPDKPFDSSTIGKQVVDECKLRFRTARQVAEEAPAEVPWVAKPWLAKATVTELTGKPKSGGKTTLTMHLVAACLDGLPFLGEPTMQTSVVYLTEERPTTFKEALRRAGLLERDDLAVLHWHDTLGTEWPDVVAAAVAECRRMGAQLLVVDTLGQFAGLKGEEESTSGAAFEAIAPLQQAAALGIAVLIIRHQRKGGGDVEDAGRGSSAFGGAADILLSLRRGDGNTRPSIRILRGLSRFSETPDNLVIELTAGGYINLGDESAVGRAETREAILAIVPGTEAEALTSKEILEALPETVKRSLAYEALRELTSTDTLKWVGGGTRGNPFRYYKKDSSTTSAIGGRIEYGPLVQAAVESGATVVEANV